MIGLAGGVIGIGLARLGLTGIHVLYAELDWIDRLLGMDWVMVLTAVLLAILSALAAAIYPTWRAVRIHPASQLKSL